MKKKPTKEPETPEELKAALESIGAKFLNRGEYFTVQAKEGGITRLEGDNESDALFEAWHLLKP